MLGTLPQQIAYRLHGFALGRQLLLDFERARALHLEDVLLDPRDVDVDVVAPVDARDVEVEAPPLIGRQPLEEPHRFVGLSDSQVR
jgi:hypothetical protein